MSNVTATLPSRSVFSGPSTAVAADTLPAAAVRILSVAAHDLRNPVSAMLALAESLADVSKDELNPQAREILADLLNAGEITLRLIENLFDLSTARSRELRFSIVDLEGVVRESISLNRALLARRGLHVDVRGGSHMPAARADRLKLLRVVNELLWNAMQVSERGGCIEMKLRQRARTIELAVRDEGPGMTQDQLARLFVSFLECPGGIGAHESRRGLGLAIVRAVVEAHHGQIRVISKPGAGSTFIVSLPVASSQRERSRSASVS